MRNDILQVVFLFLALIVGAGCEELLPKVFGVGFPVLLMSAQFLAARGRSSLGFLFAIAAGAVEDALSSLTPMTSVSFFLLVAVLVRRTGAPWYLVALTYPCYQLWLTVWTGGLNVFTRILLSVPIGFLTAFVVGRIVFDFLRRAAIDERG